jgi:large subunit ribosomal protein L18
MAKDINHRQRIHFRIRKKVSGTESRPRVAVYRSKKHFYMQAIDDEKGTTIASVSSIEKSVRDKLKGKTKTEKAKSLGEALAARLKDKKIDTVVFDRGGFNYHGRIKSAAESLRSAGIKI